MDDKRLGRAADLLREHIGRPLGLTSKIRRAMLWQDSDARQRIADGEEACRVLRLQTWAGDAQHETSNAMHDHLELRAGQWTVSLHLLPAQHVVPAAGVDKGSTRHSVDGKGRVELECGRR
jgi:hypothetical protein